ncbi:hypothetical protein [Pengzhenrongella phosphoraccumulans]|uniref:hypothetical protein n=1 Tax=Pengzhenrongella phosphoraccumulans TaxID=3114394 RepID=UPI00389089E2
MHLRRPAEAHLPSEPHRATDASRLLGPGAVARAVVEMTARTRILSDSNAELASRIDAIDRLRADLIERAGRGTARV